MVSVNRMISIEDAEQFQIDNAEVEEDRVDSENIVSEEVNGFSGGEIQPSLGVGESQPVVEMHLGDEENNSRNDNEHNQQNINNMNTNNDVAGGGAEISDEVAAEVPSLLLKNAVPRKDDIIEYRENASDESVSA